MQPYFYNNYLHSKKEKENLNETLKKLETFSKNEVLTSDESNVIQLNKVILLLRSNKFNEATKEFKLISLKDNEKFASDLRYVLVNCYLVLKSEKSEKLEDFINSKESYKKSAAPTINHFYEKLLLLKNKMNTTTGKQMAEQRHLFMETYLEQFYKEWEGKK